MSYDHPYLGQLIDLATTREYLSQLIDLIATLFEPVNWSPPKRVCLSRLIERRTLGQNNRSRAKVNYLVELFDLWPIQIKSRNRYCPIRAYLSQLIDSVAIQQLLAYEISSK